MHDPISMTPAALAQRLLHMQPTRIELRTTGRSGAQSYLVVAGECRYMLKIDAPGRSADRWRTSTAIQRAAAERGVTPAVVTSDEACQAVLCAYVEDRGVLRALFDPGRSDAVLGSLIDQVAALHRIDASPYAPDVSPLQRCRRTLARGAVPSFARAPWDDLLRREVPDCGDTLGHLDLNPSNLVFDGQTMWLVDWDTAGPSNRWLDLATIVNMLLLSQGRTRWVLERYAAACGVAMPDPEAFADARRLVYVAYGCAFLDLVARPPDRLPLGEVSLATCYGALQSGRLDMDSDASRYQLAQAYFAGYAGVA